MEELEALVECVHPDELLLVVDMMTGQDALNIARAFSARLPLTGIMLTRAENESRGGVALSMRVETGCPIRLLGTGEHLNQLEVFDAKRIANRLLGMGDVVALVEQAEALMQEEETQDAMAHFQKGTFTLEDFRKQLKSVNKMGGVAKIVKMLPGASMLEGALKNSGESDQSIMHQIAIISSMTPKERRYYKLINGPRRRRIAGGSGRPIQEVNKLIKNYERLLDMQKKLKKLQDRPGFSDKLRGLFGP
jgi:signal recognition particle subunit SRP54